MAGIRDSKTVDGVTYNYLTLDGKVVRQTWGSNVLDIIYDNSGLPYALKYNGGYYIYVLNQQGDVIRIVNGTGATVAEYRYDAWGNVIYSNGSMAAVNPIRYRGYYYDTETGFYYLQSRYYDPAIGRFINADGFVSTGQGFIGDNMFAYCLNNAVGMFDPNGSCSKVLLWKIDCGKATCNDSNNYNPSAKRIAVLYDSRTSGYLGGLFGGKGFKDQGATLISVMETTYNVEAYPFTTMDGFVDSWNSLEGEYDKIYILSHGYAGGLSCAGQSISNCGTKQYSFSDLNSVSAKTVNLFSCNGATFGDHGSVAESFAQLTNGSVWAVHNGKLSYSFLTHIPTPAKGGVWSVTRGNEMFCWN